MSCVKGRISFLADLPLYQTEKPYLALLSPKANSLIDPAIPRHNLEWEDHILKVKDIRNSTEYHLGTTGFEVHRHHSKVKEVTQDSKCTHSNVAAYQRETETFLKGYLDALWINCYGFRIRENHTTPASELDLDDILLVEGPAKGAHNDVTAASGPRMINNYVPPEILERYPTTNFRYRIVNTWRILNVVAEDNPLTFCDFRTIDPEDLIEADRIVPNYVGEVYYIRYNEQQQWCTLKEQTPEEVIVMLMYDTKPGKQARYCPHVAFDNLEAPKYAATRRSVETRSIVISEL